VTLVAGVDLSGPSNLEDTALVVVAASGRGRWRVVDWMVGASDAELIDEIRSGTASSQSAEAAIGLDAPLGYNPGGGYRPADDALSDMLDDRGFPSDSVMPPTMTRMVYLTLRGMSLARDLEARLDCSLLEVHPTSALYLRTDAPSDVESMKESAEARRRLVERLGLQGAPVDAVGESDHLVAALAAARATADWVDGEPRWSYPADPPASRYPLIC